MGSPCEVHVYASSRTEGERIIECCVTEVDRIESRYSRHLTTSTLFDINRVALHGGEIKLDPETAALVDYAFACFEKSDGAFDITSGLLRKAWDFSSVTVPEHQELCELLKLVGLDKVTWQNPVLNFTVPGQELDFGGIAKEYAAVRAAEVCRDQGANHGLVDLGGDIQMLGPHTNDDPWDIQIQHPRLPDTVLTTLQLRNGGLASSGDYERCIVKDGKRYGHILDPRTGFSVNGLAAVTVVAKDCLVAGSLATIAMLKGAKGPAWLVEMGVHHLWVDEHGHQGGDLVHTKIST